MSNLECSDKEYDVLYEKYNKMIHMFAKKYLKSCVGSDYEDLVQEGVMIMLRAKNKYREGKNASFATYLYTSIRRGFNNISKAAKQDKAKKEVLAERTKSTRKFISDQFMNSRKMSKDKDLCIMLREELEKMSERDRKVIEMKADGNTYSEIGKELGCSAQYAKVLQTKALKKIKRKLTNN